MKRNFILLLFGCCLLSAFSQHDDARKYALKLITNHFQLGHTELYDAYLSPLYYRGHVLQYNHHTRRYFNPEKTTLSRDNLLSTSTGLLSNPAGTASMVYLDFRYGWGVHYHFRPVKNLQILAGGIADAGVAYKMIARNVNNPVNVDIATNINLSAVVQYKIPLRRRDLLLQATLMTPVWGLMFVPEKGASYYEVVSLNNFRNTFHHSSFHNKYGLTHQCTIDIPFKKSVLQVGYAFRRQTHQANELVFKNTASCFLIGWRCELHAFAGRKTKIPDNFISPNP
ncbi:MAG: DUF3316 domain-containing protein [Prevotellaceae bacterium]|jgi:hypothetical protein|nr:DUF3316 domain-containing protein [Prevotellaceae bacterium]